MTCFQKIILFIKHGKHVSKNGCESNQFHLKDAGKQAVKQAGKQLGKQKSKQTDKHTTNTNCHTFN